MKSKTLKRTLIISGAVLLVAYISFCIVDCVRLRKSARYTEPLITFSVMENPNEGYADYRGLGYKIRYKIPKLDRVEDGITYYDGTGEGAEFSWLGVPIWGWWL